MENRNIIILLIVIIIVLAVVLGAFLFDISSAKQSTKIKITSDKTQYVDDGKLSIKLTDLNKTPISKGVLNVTITNSDGKVVVDDVVKTNSKGKAEFDLNLKKGKYIVNVSYDGNENYTGNNTTQKLNIKEAVAKVVSSKSSVYIEGPEYDSQGISKQQAIQSMRISGQDVKYDSESGSYIQYDPKYGVYHD